MTDTTVPAPDALRIYVCSPLRADSLDRTVANVERAREISRDLLLAGHAAFAPHLLFPQLLDDAQPEQRELGLRAGLAWLAVADALYAYGPVSEGMESEITAAAALGIPIHFPTEKTR